MRDPTLPQDLIEPPASSGKGGLLRQALPFLTVLVLAIFGVAYTNISGKPLVGYWEFLAVAIGVVCVVNAWPKTEDRRARVRLIGTQAAHWATFLITMNIVLLPGVQKLLPQPGASLVLLMLLALATFLAGVNLLSVQMCFLGLAMAVSVPAIAWLKQAALFLVLAASLVIGLAVAFWPRKRVARSPETS